MSSYKSIALNRRDFDFSGKSHNISIYFNTLTPTPYLSFTLSFITSKSIDNGGDNDTTIDLLF